jgi:hypothetical protein
VGLIDEFCEKTKNKNQVVTKLIYEISYICPNLANTYLCSKLAFNNPNFAKLIKRKEEKQKQNLPPSPALIPRLASLPCHFH